MKKQNEENSVAVIPYIVYDALMERFEKTQKNLRAVTFIAAILAVGLVLRIVKGTGNADSKDT